MKKLPLILLLTFTTMTLSAQNFRFGITAKPLVSFLKVKVDNNDVISSAENDGVKIGFSYGLQSEFIFADNYSLEVDVNHVLTGGNFVIDYVDNLGFRNGTRLIERRWNLQYLEIPIALRMKTNEIGYWTYYAKFGFNPSLNLVSRGDEVYDVENDDDHNRSKDVEIDAKLISLGNVIGAGAMYSIGGNTYLSGGLSFHNGFTQIDNLGDVKVKLSFVSLDLGILF